MPPLGRHSPPRRDQLTLPYPLPSPPSRARTRVGNLSEVSESYPQPGRFPSRVPAEYYPRRGETSTGRPSPAEGKVKARRPPTIRFFFLLFHRRTSRQGNYFSAPFLSRTLRVNTGQMRCSLRDDSADRRFQALPYRRNLPRVPFRIPVFSYSESYLAYLYRARRRSRTKNSARIFAEAEEK